MSISTDRGSWTVARDRILVLFLAAFTAVMLTACSNSPDPAKTQELQPHPISTPSLPAIARGTPTPAQVKETAAPKTDEVVGAVARVFNKAATVDESYTPSVLVGDFNGDGSEDIAIVIKPNPSALTEINNELANWTLEDVRDNEQPTKPKPAKAEKDDELIAIIHGVGEKGWRNPQARQTFLLRNALGKGPVVEPARRSSAPTTSAIPTAAGDIIRETINNHRGLIYWNGARYALRLSSE